MINFSAEVTVYVGIISLIRFFASRSYKKLMLRYIKKGDCQDGDHQEVDRQNGGLCRHAAVFDGDRHVGRRFVFM